jgi:hypothetical protein
MMTEKQLFLVIAIICLVLFIVYKLVPKDKREVLKKVAPIESLDES